MADAKITQLTENTSPVLTDIIPQVKDPGGTPVTEKVTLTNISTLMNANLPFAAGSDVTTGTSTTKVVTPKALADAGVTLTASSTNTLTNKRITKRVLALSAGSATPTIDTDTYDVVHITAQSAAINTFTTNLSGTPNDGDTLRISITDDGTARALTWGTSFESSGNATLPTTTVVSTRLDVGFVWNTETTKWRCVAAV